MSPWYEINIEPRDILFFRGGKPMGGSTLGEGGRLPMPSVFHQALLSALHERWPDAQTKHQHIRDDENKGSSFLYGDLQTVGVFPSLGSTTYFPMPADVQCLDDSETPTILQPGTLEGKSDLPSPLEMGLFKDPKGTSTKKTPNPWISEKGLQAYLTGEIPKEEDPELFDVEARPGIGIDPQTLATEEGKFYLAEVLRLRDGVTLKGFACGEAVEAYFSEARNSEFIFGGQRGVAFLEAVRDGVKLPTFGRPTSIRIKWVTLTPSIFTSGWLPSWVDAESGKIVGVETTKPERKPRESRKDWRARFEKKEIPGKLIAACIPKPVPYSGWKAQCGQEGPRPTRLCVPAGAVYYFETTNPAALTQFLNAKCKSDIAAEKGFGFGLCGSWTEYKGEIK
ncbi:MAG: type III-B CRISPR module-associated Cmr3 family protein [Pontiella sp.]